MRLEVGYNRDPFSISTKLILTSRKNNLGDRRNPIEDFSASKTFPSLFETLIFTNDKMGLKIEPVFSNSEYSTA